MKKNYILFLLLMVGTLSVSAQEFKKFKVGLGLGYASASGEGSKGGVLVYMEPSYRISDAIAVGLRIESALVTRGYSKDLDSSVELDVASIGSYTVNAQYYFNTNKFRPFVGAGLGIFSLAAIKADVAGSSVTAIEKESKFGFYPRVGFDFGHLNMSIDYNMIPKTDDKSASGNVVGNFKNSYLGVRLGFSIGGGKK